MVSVPSRGMGGFLQKKAYFEIYIIVSVPSRGMGGFLPHILYPQRDSTHKIIPTWKLS